MRLLPRYTRSAVLTYHRMLRSSTIASLAKSLLKAIFSYLLYTLVNVVRLLPRYTRSADAHIPLYAPLLDHRKLQVDRLHIGLQDDCCSHAVHKCLIAAGHLAYAAFKYCALRHNRSKSLVVEDNLLVGVGSLESQYKWLDIAHRL